MKILIETIPHDKQRYRTVGDFYTNPDGVTVIRVSEEIGDKYALLVAIHELIEKSLCDHSGVTQEQVDAFDIEYEQLRPPGDCSEPGDSPNAPYAKEHFFATNIERLLAGQLGVDWELYEETLNQLP